MTFKPHPAAELFPLMTGADFAALVADIREHGLREPIIVTDGLILDGRNRARACEELGITPATREWDREGSAQAFVISHNLHRRHLNEAQRAAVAARIVTSKTGQRIDRACKQGPVITGPIVGVNEAAALLQVSPASVSAARTVIERGTPEEVALMDEGQLSPQLTTRAINRGETARERAKAREGRGRNDTRTETLRRNADMWGRLRDTFDNLKSLPLAADVVAVMRRVPAAKSAITVEKLDSAIQWLEAFRDGWKSHE